MKKAYVAYFSACLALTVSPSFASADPVGGECFAGAKPLTGKLVSIGIIVSCGDAGDASCVSFVEYLGYRNTTRGSFNQEYEATIALHFNDRDRTEEYRLVFYSPFICDNLVLRSFG